MIIHDTETTGLPKAIGADLKLQPHIIEYAAIKLDDETMEEVGRIEFLCKPPLQILDPQITRITGLTIDDLVGEKPFSSYYGELNNFFEGEKYLVAHNAGFDKKLLTFELKRFDKFEEFNWPEKDLCTVEKSYHYRGYRMKLSVLYDYLFSETFEDAHRAMADVEALTRCVVEMRKRGDL